jgi:hypothetical protein
MHTLAGTTWNGKIHGPGGDRDCSMKFTDASHGQLVTPTGAHFTYSQQMAGGQVVSFSAQLTTPQWPGTGTGQLVGPTHMKGTWSFQGFDWHFVVTLV